jgi:glucokinase-like ROK family protein
MDPPARPARRSRPAEGTSEAARQPSAGATEDGLDAFVLVLDEIRYGRSRSRSELVEHTGLGRGVLAQRLKQLIGLGLIVEGDVGPSTGGRPPRQITFRADAGHIVVADLGATSIDVAVTDLEGRILGHRDEPADIAAGPEQILGRVDDLFADLRSATRDLPGELWGVGIGIPGPVEFRTGRPISPPIMPGWDGYAIRERFAERYDAPVWVDNDVNLLALGEWRSGIAAGHDQVVVLKIGTGIGAGIISNGHIHRGAQGSAGDVGHIQVVDDAAVICRCGNVGCLEALAGGGALGRAGEAAALAGESPRLRTAVDQHGQVTAADVARAASFGDPVAVGMLQDAGRRVGLVLASIVNFFNPSLIVVGGGVAQSGDQLLASIRETVYRRSLPLATRDLVIQRSSLGAVAGVVGASAMVVDQLFSRESMARWRQAEGPPAILDAARAAEG